jgi:hypothetical protein
MAKPVLGRPREVRRAISEPRITGDDTGVRGTLARPIDTDESRRRHAKGLLGERVLGGA